MPRALQRIQAEQGKTHLRMEMYETLVYTHYTIHNNKYQDPLMAHFTEFVLIAPSVIKF